MKKNSFLAKSFLVLAMVFSVNVSAQELNQVTFNIANDTFFGQDGEETGSWELIFSDLHFSVSEQLARWVVFDFSSFHKIRMLEIGQEVFTPLDITIDDPKARPYAGILYVKDSVYLRQDKQLHSFGITVGVIGRASLSGALQKTWHKATGCRMHERAWEDQIKDEPLLNFDYEYRHRQSLFGICGQGFGADIIFSPGFGLGLIKNYVSCSSELRCGWNVPCDFGNSYSLPTNDHEGKLPFGIFLLLGTEGEFVVHDITLDGNNFRASRSVERRFLVGRLLYGLGLTYGPMKIVLENSLNTPKHKGNNKVHQTSSLIITFMFDKWF